MSRKPRPPSHAQNPSRKRKAEEDASKEANPKGGNSRKASVSSKEDSIGIGGDETETREKAKGRGRGRGKGGGRGRGLARSVNSYERFHPLYALTNFASMYKC